MNKSAIFTIAIHNLDYFKYTLPTIERYAERIGVDFIKLETEKINYHDLHYEKFYIAELLERYERVLMLDADIIVTPHAENIFEVYPDKNTMYAYNENGEGVMNRDTFVEGICDEQTKWLKRNNKYVYFNAGVVLMSNTFKHILTDYKGNELPHWDKSVGLCSQTLLNYMAFKNKIPFYSLGYSFNRMFLGEKDEQCARLKADFIHYAGNDTFSNGDKLKTIKHDYEILWGKK